MVSPQDPRTSDGAARMPLVIRLVLLGCAGVLGSALIAWSTRGAETAAAHGAFERIAAEHVARTRRELLSSVEQLRSTLSLFESSQHVEEAEFRTFTQRSLERCAALRALVWIPATEPEEGEVLYAEGPSAQRLAPGSRPESSAAIRRALARARARGQLAVSSALEGFPGEGECVFATLPAIDDGALRGFVGCLLDVGRFVTPTEGDRHGLALRIEDVSDESPSALASAGSSELEVAEDFDLGGRHWRIVCAAPEDFVGERTSRKPWILLVLGLVATGLLIATLAQATGRAQVERLVDRRNQEVLKAYDSLAVEAHERLSAVVEARQLERQLREIIDLVPDLIYVKDWHGRFLLANEATAEARGTSVAALQAEAERALDADAEPNDELREERALMEARQCSVSPVVHFVDARGRKRILRVVKIPYDPRGRGSRALLCVATDVTDQKHAEDVLRTQNRILAELATDTDPERVLADLVNGAEELVPGMRCSVLVVSPDGRHLRHLSAPSLPSFFNEAVDGTQIGPEVGSCGAAAATGRRVIVEDVLTHPNWASARDLVRRAGIRACWSQPIRSADGEVLGTFALYYSEPRAPEQWEERLMETMAHVAGISIERGREASPPRG